MNTAVGMEVRQALEDAFADPCNLLLLEEGHLVQVKEARPAVDDFARYDEFMLLQVRIVIANDVRMRLSSLDRNLLREDVDAPPQEVEAHQ